MRKNIPILMVGLLMISLNVFADDVSIDSSGNVKTGVSNSNAELEVTGGSAEGAIRGMTSGTGASGVYGINTSFGDYGILGYYGTGVYGFSSDGYAGFFQGNTTVTGNMTAAAFIGDGSGLTNIPDTTCLDAGVTCFFAGSASEGGAATTALSLSANGSNCPVGQYARGVDAAGNAESCSLDIDTNTTYSAGTGLDLTGTTFSVEVPLALFGSASGGILSGENISPTGFGVWGRAANSSDVSNIGVYGQADGSYGAGVYGIAGASGGTNGNYGGWFEANGGAGWGVYARSHGTSGIGVYGHALNGGTGGYFNSEGGYGLIVQNGNVGIGTTSPVRNLEVASDQLPSNIVATGYRDGAAYSAGVFNGRKARGTMASPSAVQTDDILAAFGGYGYYDDGGSGAWPAGNTAVKARMQIVAAENWTVSAQGAYINFLTTPIDSLTRAEVMRITDVGNVGIGTTAPNYKLEVTGDGGILKLNSGFYGQIFRVDSDGQITYSPSIGIGGTAINFGGGNVGLGNSSANLVLINSVENSNNGNLLNVQEAGTTRFVVKQEGNVGIGTTSPQSTLQVNGYAQLALTSGAPPSVDCDETAERGRMKVDNVNGLLYICVDSGWVSK